MGFQFLLAQSFDGPVGSPGCLAIPHSSANIKGWGTKVYELKRGWKDIALPDSGLVSAGEADFALGPALENGVISLGDGGSITMGFENPVSNEQGPDLVVFENGFSDIFLELALVSVSSDGLHFFTFPAESESDTTQQIMGFGAIDPHRIHNLAGKYKAGFGTPFDLDEIPDNPLLNKNSITHVRVSDVVGSINHEFASRDSKGRKINDPYPTPYFTGGFDLDAVGVIHEMQPTAIQLWPNPLTANFLVISGLTANEPANVDIFNASGALLKRWNGLSGETKIQPDLHSGIYLVRLRTATHNLTQRIWVP